MKFKNWIKLSVILIAFYSVLHIIGIGCPIKFLTGIPCAGCGMTRSWLSVLKLDFSMAFYYHPLFWILPLALVGILLKKRIPKRMFQVIMWGFILIFIAVYLIRMLGPYDTVLKIDIDNGAIWRCLNLFNKGR